MSATGLDMEAFLGASQNATAQFTVTNSGGGTLIWPVSTSVAGVSASPAEGLLDAGRVGNHNLQDSRWLPFCPQPFVHHPWGHDRRDDGQT